MELRKYRWSKVYESAEEELLVILRRKGVEFERWEAEPGEVFEPHVHEFDKTLWCAEGSVIFTIDNTRISLQPGDTLDIPANTMHEAAAGLGGCVCYESHF
jgi:quercetin dioxygenase-like cupin family protein